MPNRILRDCCDSEPVNAVSVQAERLFYRLIQKADDFGRLPSSPRVLRPMLFPLLLDTVREADLSRWLKELDEVHALGEPAGLIRLYEVNGREYLEIQNFHQRLRTKTEKYPPPPDARNGRHVAVNGPPRDRHTTARREVKGSEGKNTHPSAAIPKTPAREPPPVVVAAAGEEATAQSELERLGLTGAGLRICLAKHGITAAHVALLGLQAEREAKKREDGNPAGLIVHKCKNGWEPKPILAPAEVERLSPRVLRIGEKIIGGETIYATKNTEGKPGVKWKVSDGDDAPAKFEGLPAEALIAESIVLSRA